MLKGRTDFSLEPSISTANLKIRCQLDFVLQHAEGDKRAYLEVEILGRRTVGLLDTGATHTMMGRSGWKFLQELGISLESAVASECDVQVANGITCECLGMVTVPMKLVNRVRLVNVLVVPTLSHHLYLGADFFVTMGLVPDLKRGVWHFSEDVCLPEIASICEADELTTFQREALDGLLNEKFNSMGDVLGITALVEHEIITDSTPIKQRYYPVSPVRQRMIEEEVRKMLELDVIEPSRSAWSSPVLLVPKKDGTTRFCVDYRKLNAVTKKDAYPLPYISSILDRLREARYLSSLDIKSAYWQVPISKASREKTAFTVPGLGLYHFKRMPFGLTNAPATFQRLIDTVLGADLQNHVLVYLDDIIVISRDFETHLEVLHKVFDRLHAAGLTVGREKCGFCRPQLKYLGYVVDKYGLRVDPEKVEAIMNVPTPKNSTQVRAFVGMASWYRRFVPDFATIVSPLTDLTKKNCTFRWTQECEEAFVRIKQQLVVAPILTCPDFSRPFIMQTDASAYGLGAVLTQNFEDGERVIAFLSRSLTRQERAYTTTERECLAVIWAMEKLKQYLDGVHFTVITDHYSLLWLDRLKNPTGRLARWAVRMQGFDFTIVHRKGKEHVVPDFLSRSVPEVSATCNVVKPSSDEMEPKDPWYRRMRSVVIEKPGKYPAWRVEEDRLLKYSAPRISQLSDGTTNWKYVVPKKNRRDLLERHHDDVSAGHLGTHKTYWRLRERYYWPKMRSDVAKYVRNCKVCAQHKVEHLPPAGLMGQRPEISSPWELISLDFVGPLPRSSHGNRFVLVVTDYFSKYVVMFPVRNATASALTRCVEEQIFLVYGVPASIICDNGTQLRSREFSRMCGNYKTKILYDALYYPRANPTERTNRTAKTMIASYIKQNQRKWDDNLAALACAMRTARHEITGYTPFFANFGRDYIGSGELHTKTVIERDKTTVEDRVLGFQKMYVDIREKLKLATERYRRRYNLRRRPVSYQVGERVWKKNKMLSDAVNYYSSKLAPKYVGPFRILKKHGNWTYELGEDCGRSIGVWHVQDLKPVHSELEIV